MTIWTSTPQFPGCCSSPQLPGNRQVGPVYYKRGCLPSSPSLTLTHAFPITPLLPSCSPSLCSPPPHVAMACLYFLTLSLSLTFYNKHLKTRNHLSTNQSPLFFNDGIGLTLKSHMSPPAAKPLSISSHQIRPKTLTSWEPQSALSPCSILPSALGLTELPPEPSLCSQLFHNIQ